MGPVQALLHRQHRESDLETERAENPSHHSLQARVGLILGVRLYQQQDVYGRVRSQFQPPIFAQRNPNRVSQCSSWLSPQTRKFSHSRFKHRLNEPVHKRTATNRDDGAFSSVPVAPPQALHLKLVNSLAVPEQ